MAASGYRELIGSLLWIARVDRPDIQAAVSILCRFNSNPSRRHLAAAKGVLAYLAGTKDVGTRFTKAENLHLTAYSDSDWAGDRDTRHSTTGFLLLLGNSPIMWYSGKQNMVTTSSTEAEYVALSHAAKEVTYIRNLLESIQFPQPTTIIYGDNQGALFLGDNPKTSSRTKHIDIKFHHIRELTENNFVKLVYIQTKQMIADVLTKPLDGPKFNSFLDVLLNRHG